MVVLGGGLVWELGRETESYPERELAIQSELNQFPDRLGIAGQWVAVQDVPVPSNQTSMLGLVGHVSRQYQRLGTSPPLRAVVFVAHARDARSMAGHHPPNCYPASGWLADTDAETEFALTNASGTELRYRLYRFSRGDGEEVQVWVGNGFLAPGHGATSTLAETKSVSERAATSRLGLTQFQIVLPGALGRDAATAHLEEIIGALPETLYDAVVFPQLESLRVDDGDPT